MLWQRVVLDICSGCKRLAGDPASEELCNFPSSLQEVSPALWCADLLS